MKSRSPFAILLAFGIAVYFGTALRPVAAATPREELLRLVPGDAGFCLVIGDLRDHSDRFLQSSWFKALRRSPLWEIFASSPEVKKLDRFLSQDLQKNLQIDWPRLRDDILGDAMVFAYRPGPSGRPEQESGLFLLWARDGELLTTLVNRLNRVQLLSGEVKAVQPCVHQGKKYFERIESKGERYVYYPVNAPMQVLPVTVPVPMSAHQYYYLDGPLLAFSGDREALLRVIEARAVPADGARLNPVAAQVQRAGAGRALVAWWMNTRVFDASLQEQAGRDASAEALGLKSFLRYWQALDALVVSLDVNSDFIVNLSVQGRREALPPAARRLLTTASRPSELWSCFPPDYIFAMALRVDAVALGEVLAEFMSPEVRKASALNLQRTLGAATGMEASSALLPELGPDVGFCVLSPPAGTDFPHVLAALRVHPGTTAAPVDQALVKAVRFFAGLAVFDHNRRHGDQVRLESVVQDKIEISYLSSGKVFPTGLQPAVALKEGYLVLASTPEAIRLFHAQEKTAEAGSTVPLLRLSVPELGRFLQARREALSGLLAERNHISSEAAQQWFDKLQRSLALFDGLEVTQRADAGQILLTVRLRTNRQAR